jgi:hypothetical protein
MMDRRGSSQIGSADRWRHRVLRVARTLADLESSDQYGGSTSRKRSLGAGRGRCRSCASSQPGPGLLNAPAALQ